MGRLRYNFLFYFLSWFSYALRLKIFWRGLIGNTLWSSILYGKYIKMNLVDWVRIPNKMSRNISPIWKGFLKNYLLIGMNLTWKVGNGMNVIVGIDPTIGLGEN